MATLYIAEYAGVANASIAYGPSKVPGQAPQTPPLAEQTLNIAGSATASNPFGPNTAMVRVNCDATCSVAFGITPIATATNQRLVAGQTEFFGVVPGHSISVISNV